MSASRAAKNGRSSGSQAICWPPESVLNPGPTHQWARTVVFDLHEVVVKWFDQFAKYVNLTYGLNVKEDDLTFYSAGFDPGINLSPDQFEKAFASFARLSQGGYGDLAPIQGIREAMQQVRDAGIRIEIWTWTPGALEIRPDTMTAYGSGIAQRVTMDLIRKLGLPIDPERDVRFMSPEQKKWEMARRHIPLIVEDNPETAVGVALGIAHACILVPKRYNELTARNILRLSHISELAQAIIEFFAKLDEAGVLL